LNLLTLFYDEYNTLSAIKTPSCISVELHALYMEAKFIHKLQPRKSTPSTKIREEETRVWWGARVSAPNKQWSVRTS